MQEKPNNIESAPKPELTLQERKERCIELFKTLSQEDMKRLDQALNIVGAPAADNFHISIEVEEDERKLDEFRSLLARYKVSTTLIGDEAKKDGDKALKDIANLF